MSHLGSDAYYSANAALTELEMRVYNGDPQAIEDLAQLRARGFDIRFTSKLTKTL